MRAANSGAASHEEMTTTNAKKTSPVMIATINSHELQRIKGLTNSPTEYLHQLLFNGEDDAVQHERSPKTSQQMEVAKARKEYMKQLELKEMEEQRKMGFQCDKAKLERIRKQAQEKIDDEEDIVKLLKTCKERAMTFAIRDQQLKDKAEREKKEQDYEQRMVLAMEIDRLREIEAREVEEACRVKKMVDARKIIEHQIQTRQQERILSEEAKEAENREMLERIAAYQAQDEDKARARRDIAMKMQMDIIRANEEDIALKRERSVNEKRENEVLLAYRLEQDAKMRQREEAAAEAERQRCLEFKIQQERLVDRRSEIDELRERRAFEERERRFRQKQLLDAQKKKHDKDILDLAMLRQREEKTKLKLVEMEQKREEYESALEHSRAMAEREREEAEETRKKNELMTYNLQQQIEQKRAHQNALHKDKYVEGALIKQQFAEEREHLEAVRNKFINDMKEKNIDERYYSEMKALDIGKQTL